MRLVLMNGGLGNQALQYIFLRWLEEKGGEPCVIDDLPFCGKNTAHNGYELEKIFSIRHTRLSELLDRDVVEEILNCLTRKDANGRRENLIHLFKGNGMELFPIQEGNCYTADYGYQGSIFSVPLNAFYPDVLRWTGDLYYYGYWINGRWFNDIKDIIVREFTFPLLPDEKNRAYMNEIKAAGDNSLAIHIRRGDFVTVGWALSCSFYANVLPEMRKRMGSPKIFVFSDDILWVKEHFSELGFLSTDEIIFVEGNMNGNNYIDMQLMAACRGMIIANSSFSYLAALLNRNPEKLIANPTEREIF